MRDVATHIQINHMQILNSLHNVVFKLYIYIRDNHHSDKGAAVISNLLQRQSERSLQSTDMGAIA